MSTVNEAKRIRTALKAIGVTSKMVSVRSHLYSMGSSIRIEIKSTDVDRSQVEAIAEPSESISRDQFGEILGGGNRYVSITYSSECRQAKAAPFIEAVAAALELVEGSSLIPVGDTKYLVGRDQPCHWNGTLWHTDNGGMIHSFQSEHPITAALTIAEGRTERTY